MLELLSLPPEIIEKITEYLGGTHKKTVRRVCRYLNEIVEHQLFSNIVLKYSNYQPDLICEQLEALASRTTTARIHARSLEIRGFSPDSHLGARSRSRSVERNRNSRSRSRGPLAEAHSVNKGLLAHLGQAICSLRKVQEVWWHVGMHDPEWVQIVVMDSLVSLPALSELRISLGGGTASSLKLEQLTDLRKITITGSCLHYRRDVVSGLRTLISNSPRLTHLDVGHNYRSDDSDISTLHDLLGAVPPASPLNLSHLTLRGWCIRLDDITLPHLRSLVSLSLHVNLDTRTFSPSDLDDSAHEELLRRTAAFSSSTEEIWDTLREERICLKELTTDEVNDALLDYLSSYSGLQKLTLTSATAHSAKKSDALAMKFYRDVLPKHAGTLVSLDVCPVYEGKWCFGKHNSSSLLQCTKLSNLKIHINSEDINRAKKQDVVWTLLEVAEDLPNLSQLSISSADSESNRGGRSGSNPSIGHIYRVNKEISQSVTTFGPLDSVGVSKIITTPARDYVARSDKQAGDGLWYRSSMSQGSHLEL
ncbi:hypothetical protein JR316_0008505 [Psilocybe cubensis]|uniref:F-box domain-containing protein n=2 Tax=Psilocybe cubensis TaxID=181762 RepID=A0A8H7XIT9_PSICU|nr:hypothetical protein JR316_0008505 [Psilocybe cubensis]KAH9479909.1 hypothetical protein JR316_0008505 [Psilocybe cubensis]